MEWPNPFKIQQMLKGFLVSNGVNLNVKALVGIKCVAAVCYVVSESRYNTYLHA